jgi:hypothetical protein
MIIFKDRKIYIHNRYRKQLFFFLTERLKKVNEKTIVSDFPSLFFFPFFFFLKKRGILWFLWNDANELLGFLESKSLKWIIKKTNPIFIFQFEPQKKFVNNIKKSIPNFKHKVIQGKILKKQFQIDSNCENEIKIIFLGEVNIGFDGLNLDEINEVKIISKKVFDGKLSYDEIQSLLQLKKGINLELALFYCKNLIRFKYLKFLEKEYPKYVKFYGNDILKLEFLNSEPSNYYFKWRIKEIYKKHNNSIFIDLLSKGSDLCLYPRSIELLSFTNIFFQLRIKESKKIYEQYESHFIFRSKTELKKLINEYLDLKKPNIHDDVINLLNTKIK